MRQSSVYNLRVEALDHVVGWLGFSFAVSPGTWPGGAWVPGGPRPGFSLLPFFHDPSLAFFNFAPGSLTFHSAQRAPPQFENHVQMFHLPSTDDELPGYMDQLACEQKKKFQKVFQNGFRVVSDWFLEGSETVWFQKGFRVV